MATSTAAEYEDMNATPLGKLPMPIIQSKADAPKIDATASTSYADILRTMATDPNRAASVQPPQQQQQQAAQQQQQQQMVQQQLVQQQMAQQQMAQQQMSPPPQHVTPQYYDPGYYDRPRPVSVRRRSRSTMPKPHRARTVLAQLAQYKNAAIVIVIVFAVMRWAAPRLAAVAPTMAHPAPPGLRTPGLLLMAALCGGIYRAAETLTATTRAS